MQDTPGHPGKPANPSTTLIRAPKPTPSVTAILFPHLITGPRSFYYRTPESATRISRNYPWLASGIPNPSTVHNRCRPATSRSKLSRVSPPSGNHEPHPKTCPTSTTPAPETGQDQRYLRGQLKLESVNKLEDAQRAGNEGQAKAAVASTRASERRRPQQATPGQRAARAGRGRRQRSRQQIQQQRQQ